ncbi:aliphatic sulfonate ABC transporter substrate-binding protein [Geobacter sp.]|uniref:aliphatic sulfonate ABC transporter substrate-binding protein n=1 Tax=Geobacter sp. TaxID=46610 RepID=UPI0027BAFBD4|nr:aliphatic sulfonate ABC transporter substrate-binding protein [Geobacter sp.]
MNRIFSYLAAAVLATLLGGMAAVAGASEIRIATQPIPHYAPIFVAKQKKWVEEELAKVGAKPALKWTSFAAGPPINESFASGQQDIGFLGDTPAIIGKAAGINTRIIGLTSTGPRSLAVIVPSASKIRSPKELKGKKVAVVKGSYAHHLLVLVLQTGGLSVNDIELINLSQADIATAIVNGNIEAAAVWEPLITKLETQEAVRVLADGTGIKKGALVIIATDDFVKRSREQVKALLRAYQRGAQFIRSNPREAARLIAADVNLPPDLLLKVFPRFDYNPSIQADDVEEIRKSEAFMRSAGLIKKPVNIDSFADPSLVRESGIK